MLKKINKNSLLYKTLSIYLYYIVLLTVYILCTNYIKSTSISYIFSYLILICIYAKRHKYILDSFNNKINDKKEIIKIISVFIFGTIIILLSTIILSKFNISSSNETDIEEMLEKDKLMLLNLFIFAPIAEELIFRGPLINMKNNRIIMSIISILLFSTMHLLSASTPLEYLYFIPYITMAFMFTYGTYKTNNILVSILMHITYNLINIMILFI